MSDVPQATAENDRIVAQWQTIITTQMHFNDMILRTRAIGSSVVLAAYGAAAVAIAQYPNEYLSLSGELIHVSAFVLFFALSLLIGIFLMDVTYYYRLLLGVVEVGATLENQNSFLVDTTNQLSRKVSLFWAHFVVFAFYAIPTVIGGISLWYVLAHFPPTIHT